MVETSSIFSGAKFGLQIVSNFKRPKLEIYMEIKNISEPPIKIPIDNKYEKMTEYRHQNIFFQFNLVNIGGIRAENIRLKFKGSETYFHTKKIPNILNGSILNYFPPSQSIQIMKVDEWNLYDYVEDTPTSKKRDGIRKDGFTIEYEYDSEKSLLSYLKKIIYLKWFTPLYSDKFEFNLDFLENFELPPKEFK